MTLFRKEEIAELSNPGVVSRQLLTPDSVPEARVTVTQVRLDPGAVQPRHVHESSEQFWYAESGEGTLLLADGAEQPIRPGDALRPGRHPRSEKRRTGSVHLHQRDLSAGFF